MNQSMPARGKAVGATALASRAMIALGVASGIMAFIVLLPVIPAALMAVLTFLPWYTLRVAEVDTMILLAPIGGLWLAVALGLLRGFPRPAAS